MKSELRKEIEDLVRTTNYSTDQNVWRILEIIDREKEKYAREKQQQ